MVLFEVDKTGISSAAGMEMMAMTTSNSIRVNALIECSSNQGLTKDTD